MIKRLVQAAMIISWCYFAAALLLAWGGELMGRPASVLDMFDYKPGPEPVPFWLLAFGFLAGCIMLASLGYAYRGVWQILEAGKDQEFNLLGNRLQWLGGGLIGFWLSWNVLTGVFSALLARYADAETAAGFGWDPLDIDIVFPIVGISIIAIARMMERAWRAEDENRHFL